MFNTSRQANKLNYIYRFFLVYLYQQIDYYLAYTARQNPSFLSPFFGNQTYTNSEFTLVSKHLCKMMFHKRNCNALYKETQKVMLSYLLSLFLITHLNRSSIQQIKYFPTESQPLAMHFGQQMNMGM